MLGENAYLDTPYWRFYRGWRGPWYNGRACPELPSDVGQAQGHECDTIWSLSAQHQSRVCPGRGMR